MAGATVGADASGRALPGMPIGLPTDGIDGPGATPGEARVESDKATERAVLGMVQDDTQLFKLFADDPDFRRWLADTAFRLAYEATR